MKKIKNLVIIQNNEIITTSEIISNGVNIIHKNVVELIQKYENDLNYFGVVTFETEKPKKGSKGGRPFNLYYLNEMQATFLITLMKNSEIVIQFKKELINQFYKLRKTLLMLSTQKVNQEWLEIRKDTKVNRLKETDIIKKYVEYAISQGSDSYLKKPELAYSNITKMENKALFILEQKYKNIRDILDKNQLDQIKQADSIVLKALNDGMCDNLHYKDIYKLAKNRIELFASLVGRSVIPNIEFKQISK